MTSQQEKKLAYEAGWAAMSEPAERRSVDACPFAPDTDERTEWLRGFGDALEEAPDHASLRKDLADALGDDR